MGDTAKTFPTLTDLMTNNLKMEGAVCSPSFTGEKPSAERTVVLLL